LFFLSASFKLCGRFSPRFATIKFHFRTVLAPGTAIRLNQELGNAGKKGGFVVYIHHMAAE